MDLDQSESSPNLALVHTGILRQFDGGLNPELGFAIGTVHMYMHPRFFTREEVEAETIFAEDCWTHDATQYPTQANEAVEKLAL